MLNDAIRCVRSLWDAILLPYVLLSIANLATDGWEAVIHLRETVVVLFFFLCGCSHRDFPLSRSAIEAQRAAFAAAAAADGVSSSSPSSAASAGAAAVHRRSAYHGSDEERNNDADSEADFAVGKRQHQPLQPLLSTQTTGMNKAGCSCSSGSTGEEELACCEHPPVQRRLLLGKKGEVEEWLPAVPSHLLVPVHHPLCVSRSLHQLVSIVMGPIQQPTVSTMPTRHPEPQWPPHYLRTSNSASSATGSGSCGNTSVGDPSTDDYSSSNSSAAAPKTMRHRLAGNSSSSSTSSSGSPRYRQATSVVYQRVSSRNLDFSSSRVAPHLIASITAHHVLSYPATRQKVLVMDLDETLCYVSTSTADMAGPPTFSEVIPTASGAELFHVWERPYARLFLSTAAKLFNLVLFTSASKPYADTILQRIDPDHLLKLRFYRQDCRLVPRGLLRKMCAVAGMRSASPTSTAGSAAGGSSSAGRHSAGPLGDFPSTGGGGGGGGGGVSTDGDGTRSSSHSHSSSASASPAAAHGDMRNWEDGSMTPRCSDHLSSGAESTDARGGGSSSGGPHHQQHPQQRRGSRPAANAGLFVASTRDGQTVSEELPMLQKTVMNEHTKVLVKDLRVLKVPPELLVMIDNSEECTLVNPENALIVSPFIPSLSKGNNSSNSSPSSSHGTTSAPQQQPSTPSPQPERSTTASSHTPPFPSLTPTTASQHAGEQATMSGGHGESTVAGVESIEEASAACAPATAAVDADEADGLLLGDDMTAAEGPEEDEVLLALLPMLECLLVVPDVRSILRHGKLY